MSHPPEAQVSSEASYTLQVLAAAAVAALVGLLAVSTESLWIDEFASLVVADHRELRRFLAALTGSEESDGQMPLYMAWLWSWIRLLGNGEWSLRAANIPFFAVGTACLVYWTIRARLARGWVVAPVAVCYPWLWFYINEARPYLMQFAGAAMFLGAIIALAARGREAELDFSGPELWVVTLGSVLLAGSSLLGAAWVATGTVGAFLLIGDRRMRTGASGRVALVVGGVLQALLGLYYLETLRRGARAATIDSSIVITLGSLVYEPLGLAGLGPGRLEIREVGTQALAPWLWIVMPAAAVVALVWAVGLRRISTVSGRVGARRVAILAAIHFVPIVLLVAYGEVVSFRVLARHVTPLVPAVLVFTAFSLEASLRKRRGQVLATLFFCVWVYSSLSLRLADRHHKDDYRAAAGIAARGLERGYTVWWVAMIEGGAYYGLPEPADWQAGGTYFAPINPRVIHAGTPPPDVIVLSKPDLFDREGAVGAYADRHLVVACELPAFRIMVLEPVDRRWACGP